MNFVRKHSGLVVGQQEQAFGIVNEIKRTVLTAQPGDASWPLRRRSLVWQGDELIDWVGGGTRYRLDGSYLRPLIYFGYRFDATTATPDGVYVVLHERLGTKGLLLKNGEFLREINRSYYHADRYEYPVTFLTLPDGRAAIAHCPEEYCKLEIDVAETGERLTARASEGKDFFHSRLSVTSNGRYLASSGWMWHPWEDVRFYDVVEVLANPELLNGGHDLNDYAADPINSAVLVGNGSLVFTIPGDGEVRATSSAGEDELLPPGTIAVYDIGRKEIASRSMLPEPAGLLAAIDERFTLGLFGHPKLIDVATGQIVARWEEFTTGERMSCITREDEFSPIVAVDSAAKRFAIATDDGITVIQLG